MKIDHVTLLTQNLKQTITFYHDKLGFEISSKNDTRVTFKIGTSFLTFQQVERQIPSYHFAIIIPKNQLLEAKNWIQEITEIIPSGTDNNIVNFVNWNAQSFYFYDNNRNIVEFIVRHDLKNKSNSFQKAASCININEIGIGTENPLLISEQLELQFGLTNFAKQPKAENFVALGDEEGLLILSRTDRNWFPTTEQVQPLPTVITIVNNNKSIELTF